MASSIVNGWTVHDEAKDLQVPGFPYQVSRRDVADILCTAFEGGSTYWLRKVTGTHPAAVYASDVPSCGGSLRLRFDLPSDEEGNGKGRFDLRLEDVLRGIALGLTKHDAILLRQPGFDVTEIGACDADAADVILQLAVMGEVVYG